METECTYSDGVQETGTARSKSHPHEEYWSCQKCLAEKLWKMQSDNTHISEELRKAKEKMNNLYSERDMWKTQALQRRGLMHELRNEMEIQENMEDDAELKAALEFIRNMKDDNSKMLRTLEYLVYQSGEKDGNVGVYERKLILKLFSMLHFPPAA